jgi:predicted metal-binding protein
MCIAFVHPVVDYAVRRLCTHPYYNHPKGCPNFGKRNTCPPQAPLIENVLDMSKKILAVWVSFNLADHRNEMRKKHPAWTRRQLDCCLYWQGRLNKRLGRLVDEQLTRYMLVDNQTALVVLHVPEANGVNVTETMKQCGVELEWPPERTVVKVALIGIAASIRRRNWYDC